ncbi:hypothetical protein AZI86_17575 [Bdellovibrio bacteriovorus]|uniref:Bdellovibrio beta-sandwich domain-containing protein n=1 Tax=Bdellovibrio bacteriovorus TaxID=959 RepID=A0A150WEH6_BDEBC|nr:beta-sandwich domain-containing protein [Bdellovibrio bacteriovorus]KYG61518.1 hypothetical protein AZI86_17575 [Bdellovibrio bacteriovorus]
MKRSLLAGSLFVITLAQSLALAQLVDLPDPGGDTGGQTQVTPHNQATPQTQTQYAGILRVGSISRKTGGTLYKVDFATAVRLQRLDVRVSSNRVKIYSATLVTTSGNKISVRQLSTSAVLETNAVVNSENITLNENVASIEILMEAYGGEADVILTALASSDVPKMSLRQEVKPQTPVVVTPTMPEDSYNPDTYEPEDPTVNDSYSPGNGSVIYYGSAKFRPGMRVLLACDRKCSYIQWVTTVVQNLGRGYILIEGGRTVSANDLSAATQCYGSFCVNDRVSSDGYEGVISMIFENGTAAVRRVVDGYEFLEEVGYLTKLSRYEPAPIPQVQFQQCTSNNEFCTGDTVRYRGITVKITDIYRNGQARVRNPLNGQTALVFIRELIFVR